jgi:pimeloyl-ACP methyl ester carboxylesterase
MHIKVANLVDRSVRYLETGSGRPLVLLHAFPLSADQWLPQLHRLPAGWRAVAPDLRGFRGTRSVLSYVGPGPVTIDTYAGDILALMTHLEIDRAIVAGLSMGGYVAFSMLRQAPARVSGLVLANTRAAADTAEGAAARDRMIALAEGEGSAGVAREMLPKLLGETSRREQPDLEQAVRALIEANGTEAIVAALRAM